MRGSSGLHAVIKGQGPAFSPHILMYIPDYFDIKPACWLHYSDSNPRLFYCISPPTSKTSDSPDHTSFDFIAAVHIWFTSYNYVIHIHLFHGNIWTHNWPASNISGFIAQLVRAMHWNHEVTGSNPIEVLIFFSGFLMQLHK